MDSHKIVAVISYCGYHSVFIERCIAEAQKVAEKVIVVSSTHFFNGEPDTEVKKNLVDYFVPFDVNSDKESRYWHNFQRLVGADIAAKAVPDYEGIFFIDADEILDGDLCKEWLENKAQVDEDYKLAHYWRYRDNCYRAIQIEEGAVLVSRKSLESEEMDWFGARERENYSKHYNYMEGYNGQVLGNHFSWSGTKEMILNKCRSWGHSKDMDWIKMVEEEYSHPFNYTCPFKPGYTFIKTESPVNFNFNE